MKLKYEEDLSPEQKMRMWHDGTRGFNVDAASDVKLRMNLEICKKLKFKTEAQLIAKELKLRGLDESISFKEDESGAQTSGDLQAFAPENAANLKHEKNFNEIYEKVLKESVDLDKDDTVESLTARQCVEDAMSNLSDPSDYHLIDDYFKYHQQEFSENDIIDNQKDYDDLVDSFMDYVAEDTMQYEMDKENYVPNSEKEYEDESEKDIEY